MPPTTLSYASGVRAGSESSRDDDSKPVMAFIPPSISRPLSEKGYRAESVIGGGGMGMVYGVRKGSMKAVAKALRPEYASQAKYRMRFEVEAAALLSVSHPNVVRCMEFFESGGKQFLIMEFAGGNSVSTNMLWKRRFSWDEAARIAVSVCDALSAVHASGIIHRDVKPSNVIVDGETVKLIDFGLAYAPGTADFPPGGRGRASGGGITTPSHVLGTPHYMAPEQCKGDRATPRTDICSLGATLFEMVAGEPPFTGMTVDVMAKRLSSEAKPLALGHPGVMMPPELDWIIMKALKRDPAQRFETAGAMREAIEGMVSLYRDRYGLSGSLWTY